MNYVRTNPNYTETVHGKIRHHSHPLGFRAPVRVVRMKQPGIGGDTLTFPETTPEGRYVYALPGGGVWVPGQVQESDTASA